jgi:hypothetical protein
MPKQTMNIPALRSQMLTRESSVCSGDSEELFLKKYYRVSIDNSFM